MASAGFLTRAMAAIQGQGMLVKEVDWGTKYSDCLKIEQHLAPIDFKYLFTRRNLGNFQGHNSHWQNPNSDSDHISCIMKVISQFSDKSRFNKRAKSGR